jgi:hypothetical protein
MNTVHIFEYSRDMPAVAPCTCLGFPRGFVFSALFFSTFFFFSNFFSPRAWQCRGFLFHWRTLPAFDVGYQGVHSVRSLGTALYSSASQGFEKKGFPLGLPHIFLQARIKHVMVYCRTCFSIFFCLLFVLPLSNNNALPFPFHFPFFFPP